MTIGLSSPWIRIYKEIKTMFATDEGITVLYNDEEKKIQLVVDSSVKAAALDILLKHEYDFGGVKLTVEVIPPDGDTYVSERIAKMCQDRDYANLFRQALERNEVFKIAHVTSKSLLGGLLYVVFTLRPAQIFTDDLSCWQGYETMLFEDIARDIFELRAGVFFSTELYERMNR